MKRRQLTRNLYLDEYIPRDLYIRYEQAGKLHRLEWKLDRELVLSDQMLRDKFGAVTINNWLTGGQRNWSGLRHEGSPYYKEDGSHSSGHASDKIFTHATAEEVRHYIIDNWQTLGITEIELDVDWVHSGTRYASYTKELITFNK